MSTRHLRKILGQPSIPPPDSDEEFEPLYTKPKASFSLLDMGIESGSESAPDTKEAEENEETDENKEPVKSTNGAKKKQKKKKNKKTKAKKHVVSTGDESDDEVERSVREVNALLGEVQVRPAPAPEPDKPKSVMTINPRHLDQNYEMDRVFGPGETDKTKKKRSAPNFNRLMKKPLIVSPDLYREHGRTGISMSVLRVERGVTYFTLDHDARYQTTQRALLRLTAHGMHLAHPIDFHVHLASTKRLNLDAWMLVVDVLFEQEKYTAAKSELETVIAFLQSIAHHDFNLTNLSVRLEYKVLENRQFHHVLLKYMHFLSNRAMHRTALEIAKVMLNLDPSDPLGVRLFIDSIAIRAREFSWLVAAVRQWDEENNATMLYNMQYTNALAHYHLAKKNNVPIGEATTLLRRAILTFPAVAPLLVGAVSQRAQLALQKRALYSTVADKWTTPLLRTLYEVFTRFVGSRWREPSVAAWLQETVEAVADQYDADSKIQEEVETLGLRNKQVFRRMPIEARRHFYYMHPLNRLMIDDVFGAVPYEVPPAPAETLDRYGYATGPPGADAVAAALAHIGIQLPQPEPEPAEDVGVVLNFMMEQAINTLARLRGEGGEGGEGGGAEGGAPEPPPPPYDRH